MIPHQCCWCLGLDRSCPHLLPADACVLKGLVCLFLSGLQWQQLSPPRGSHELMHGAALAASRCLEIPSPYPAGPQSKGAAHVHTLSLGTCFDPQTDASTATRECCHVITLPAKGSSTEHPCSQHCTISGSEETYQEKSGLRLSLTWCFGPKSWLSVEFGRCKSFKIAEGKWSWWLVGLREMLSCRGPALGGSHLGLIFLSLSSDFGTKSDFGLYEPLGWTWLSQGAWAGGGMQEELGGHLYGFFTPPEIPS